MDKKLSGRQCAPRYLKGLGPLAGNKRFICVAMLLCILINLFPFTTANAALPQANTGAADQGGKMHIFIEGAFQPHIQPLELGEGPYFPLRAVTELAGFAVHWDNEWKRITLQGAGRDVTLYPANPLYAVNGILHRTVQPPMLQGGRVFVGPDFLEQAAGLVLSQEERAMGFFHFKKGQPPLLPDEPREQPVYFIELLLPPGDRVEANEYFEIRLAAPFVRGIYAYEVSFFYNPAIIQVKDVRNPAYQPSREFFMKEVNNREGKIRYTLTTLGYAEELPPRTTLAVIEAVVSREGAVPLIRGTLMVTLMDNRGSSMPVGLEERILYVDPASPGL